MIIGLHGKMGAGKNEIARRLVQFSPLPVIEVSFAAKLKESAAAVLGCTVEDLERAKNDPDFGVLFGHNARNHPEYNYQTVRGFLQRYGTEAHRDVFGQDFWIDAALPMDSYCLCGDDQIGEGRDYSNALYVVTDVRFPNEAQRVRDLGGWVVHVVGPDEDTGSHASEQPIESHMIEATILNMARDDDFASLDRQLGELMFLAFGGSRAA